MKYKLMKLEYIGRNNEDIIVTIEVGKFDQPEQKTTPNAGGYYVYPETMTDEEAFEKLTDHLSKLAIKKAGNMIRLSEYYDKMKVDNSHLARK